MKQSLSIVSRMTNRWNAFFFAPFDLRRAAQLRVGYAALVLINFAILGLDLELFFGAQGVMPLAASRRIIDPDSRTIFELLPQSSLVLWVGYALAISHITCLLVGFMPRANAVGVFLWMLWFQNRHIMLFDGEDQVFRMFAFFFIFLPSHHYYSVHAWWRKRRAESPPPERGRAWALRLFQIQMGLVYLGAAWSKLYGERWWDGTAMWYVSRLDDVFGRFPLPDFVFNSLPMLQLMTWSTLVIETFLAVGLWVPQTRKWAIRVAVVFHLSIEYMMNLFLFHPLMLVGLLSFIATEPKHKGESEIPNQETS